MMCPYRLQSLITTTTVNKEETKTVHTEDYLYEMCKEKDCAAYNQESKKCEYRE